MFGFTVVAAPIRKKRMTDDIYFLAITPPMQQVAEVGHWQRSATAVSWWPSTVLKDVKLENLERLQMASDGFRWRQVLCVELLRPVNLHLLAAHIKPVLLQNARHRQRPGGQELVVVTR